MKRSYDKEMMDLPGQPKELLEQDLRNLRIINRYLGGSRNAVRGLKRVLRKQRVRRFSLLDVGVGSADIALALLAWAKRRGIDAQIVGIDSDPVTAGAAATLSKRFPEVAIVRADAFAPPFAPKSFDFVFASQLLHHFSEEQIVMALRNWSDVARHAIIVSDLVRHPAAYHGIRLLTKLFTRNVMTRNDAPLSVQRAFTLPEWRALLRSAGVGPVQICSAVPYRVMALIFPEGGRHAL